MMLYIQDLHQVGEEVSRVQIQAAQDKKKLKMAMDKAFHMLKEKGLSTPGLGHERSVWHVPFCLAIASNMHVKENYGGFYTFY